MSIRQLMAESLANGCATRLARCSTPVSPIPQPLCPTIHQSGNMKQTFDHLLLLILASASGLMASPGTLQAASGETNSFLCGYKYDDVNSNGIRDAGEPGLPGWTI